MMVYETCPEDKRVSSTQHICTRNRERPIAWNPKNSIYFYNTMYELVVTSMFPAKSNTCHFFVTGLRWGGGFVDRHFTTRSPPFVLSVHLSHHAYCDFQKFCTCTSSRCGRPFQCAWSQNRHIQTNFVIYHESFLRPQSHQVKAEEMQQHEQWNEFLGSAWLVDKTKLH